MTREELREGLIHRIIRLSKNQHAIYAKMCVTERIDPQKTWEEKKDTQVVFTAKSIFDDGKSPVMLNVGVWQYLSHLEDAGAISLSELSTDSLYDIVEYYEKNK